MKKNLLLLIAILSLAWANNARAQAPILGFDSTFTIPWNFFAVLDTFPVTVPVKIKNYGNAAFTGNTPIYFQTEVYNSGFLYSSDTTLNIIPQATILVDSTLGYNYFEPYNSQRFAVGIDVVVIWPKALGVSSVSTTYVIQIVSAAGVEELLAADGISVYPNPCNEQLNIKNLAPENPIEQVRFLDTDGKLILMRTRQQRIDLSELPNGIYMVELYYKSGARKILKVQKQQ